MKPASINPSPSAAVLRTEGTLAGRRIAVCVFADVDERTRLLKALQDEEVPSLALASGSADAVPGTQFPADSEMAEGETGWAGFLELVRLRTSPAIAVRLAGELAAGRFLLVIVLADSAQEAGLLPAILAGGALSVQIHDLSA